MKTTSSFRTESAAFTMIEMIGVLAVMAILAGAIAPNVLKSIERAAVSAEVATDVSIGDQVVKYLHVYGSLPSQNVTIPSPLPSTWAPPWCTELFKVSSMSPRDVWTNKRQMNRVYLLDPAAVPTPRVLILSGMRFGVALPGTPPSYNLSATQFDDIWKTVDGQLPLASSWVGPGSWAGWTNYLDYLVIQRVELKSEYRTIVLQNQSTLTGAPFAPGGKIAKYQILPLIVIGPAPPIVDVPAAPSVLPPILNPATLTLVPDERLLLFDSTGKLIYTYVVNTSGRTFNFDGNYWTTP